MRLVDECLAWLSLLVIVFGVFSVDDCVDASLGRVVVLFGEAFVVIFLA